MRLLLADPRVDPSADNNYAIRWAAYNGHTEVVRLLLADPRVDPGAIANIRNDDIQDVLKEFRHKTRRIKSRIFY